MKKKIEETAEDLITILQAVSKEKGRRPVQFDVAELSKKRLSPNVGYYSRVFGSFAGALKAAGFDINQRKTPFNHALARSDIGQNILSLCQMLGHAPSAKELDERHRFCRYFPLRSKIRTICGPLDEFYRSLGIKLSVEEAKEKGLVPVKSKSKPRVVVSKFEQALGEKHPIDVD